MQINADVSFRFHTPPRKPSGVDSLCGLATLLFKVPRGPYTGAPATGLTNLLNEVAPHGLHAACDLSTPEAFLPEPNARGAEHSYHLLISALLLRTRTSVRDRLSVRVQLGATQAAAE